MKGKVYLVGSRSSLANRFKLEAVQDGCCIHAESSDDCGGGNVESCSNNGQSDGCYDNNIGNDTSCYDNNIGNGGGDGV
ncbi:unnamed protein product [Sphenostylis stenocarpa]|uniref:Uncharacterized protein n=1 Tax=Sphenostylis stenocarpa TaxID=92480 RepID=A0AA86V2K8_9FABA|nr:unnamed protein product [Sphenostylis stenocarpa]